MSDASGEAIRRLRHDLANPMAALLAEVQLLLLRADEMDDEMATSLHDMEGLIRRMREILHST